MTLTVATLATMMSVVMTTVTTITQQKANVKAFGEDAKGSSSLSLVTDEDMNIGMEGSESQ